MLYCMGVQFGTNHLDLVLQSTMVVWEQPFSKNTPAIYVYIGHATASGGNPKWTGEAISKSIAGLETENTYASSQGRVLISTKAR